MGIPSYFSYIVKNFANIIRKYTNTNAKKSINIENLFLDCNSIIYDVYRNIENNNSDITNPIINAVIMKIEEYIETIRPTNIVYIAFDGVAPRAKLEQQRSRRYKSWYQNEVSKSIFNKQSADYWNTAAITPGTSFMHELNKQLHNHFTNNTALFQKMGVENIIVSGSNVIGEGEHKIFEYIRNNNVTTSSVIYGLDADLIMLSINHLPVCPKLYLFRETPHFIQTIDSSLEPNETYCIDIQELTNAIMKFMNTDTDNNVSAVYDYIFLCFFLGNDFLPHFPALNIRTGGIDKLMNAYNKCISSHKLCLTDGKTIYWNNVRKLVSELASLEEEYIIKEHRMRNNKEKQFLPEETPEEKYNKFDLTPVYDRELEHYINPVKPYWQYRYYRALFDIKTDTNNEKKRDIAINYLEGLEWTLKYYTSGCPDWRWKYKYNYPPLLQDLIRYIPVFNTEFVPYKPPNPVSDLVQLCYVLPRTSLHLLPEKIHKELLRTHDNWYKGNCEFVWAYCRYFWESHVEMNEININELEEFVTKNK